MTEQLEMFMDPKLVLTMDIGGTQSRVALIDDKAQVVKRTSVSTEEGEGYKKVIALFCRN